MEQLAKDDVSPIGEYINWLVTYGLVHEEGHGYSYFSTSVGEPEEAESEDGLVFTVSTDEEPQP